MAMESWEFREESFSLLASPIYPAKTVVPIGTALFLLQGTAKFIRDLTMLITGKALSNS
jgi:TRAP-type mannitol/chloroaromatic compound transport system permease small subunit